MRGVKTLGWVVLVVVGCASNAMPSPEDGRGGPEVEVEVLRDPVLWDHSRLPEQDPHFESVVVYDDVLIFSYDTPPREPLRVDDVVTGVTDDGYLRRVLSVEQVTPTRHEVRTEHAELQDFFQDVHFVATIRPDVESWTEVEGELGRRVDAARRSLVQTQPECEFSAHAGANLRIWAETDMELKIDVDIAWWWESQDHNRIHAEARGVIKGGVEFSAGAGADLECVWDMKTALGPRFRSLEFTTTFWVGPAPVVLTHRIEPVVKLRISGGVETGNIAAEATFELGAEVWGHYENGWRHGKRVVREGNASVSGSDTGVTATATLRLEAGASYLVKLYGLFGPELTVTPFAEGTIGATECEWNADIDLGLDGKVAGVLEVPVLNRELGRWEESFDITRFNVFHKEDTWSWCENEDGTGDGTEDPCSGLASACGACNAEPGCGWCGATNRCVSDSRSDSCGSDWRDSASACHACDATSCGACATSGFCVWCPGVGCVNDSVEEQYSMCGGDVRRNPSEC